MKEGQKIQMENHKFKGYPIMKKGSGKLRCHRFEDLLHLETLLKVTEFIHACFTDDTKDMEIMNRWEKYFCDRDIPYAIVRKGSKELCLWKEKVV